jgi:hypothetical protein
LDLLLYQQPLVLLSHLRRRLVLQELVLLVQWLLNLKPGLRLLLDHLLLLQHLLGLL